MGDRTELALNYDVLDGALPEEAETALPIQRGRLVIGISGTLQSMWALAGKELEMVLVEYAKQFIRDKLSERTLSEEEELQLSSSNAPTQPAFDARRIDYYMPTAFEVAVPQLLTTERRADPALAIRIVELRDNINALFSERFGGRLLALPQERALMELLRQCASEEEFTYRVVSMCGLATAIETQQLGIPSGDSGQLGSIDRLGTFLRHEYPHSDTSTIMNALAGFNRLRRTYPVHTDRAAGVLAAYEHFGLRYPVADYQAAWETLLKAYSETLFRILELLRG